MYSFRCFVQYLRDTWLKFVGAEIIFDLRSVAAVRMRLDSRNENRRRGIDRSTASVSKSSLLFMFAK